jgi:protein-tyrosine phosphatase
MARHRELPLRPLERQATRRLAVAFAGLMCVAVAAQPAHERRVTLNGATNLRDLGGYRTRDGRRVKWGLVFRSDQLAQLTDEDYAQIARLGITTVCDFRREDERQRAPTNWRGGQPPEMVVRVPAAAPPAEPIADPVGVARSGASGDEVAAAMRKSYAQNVTALAPTYAVVFKRILAGGPTLVHCTAGKDRTGIFSALFLLVLGVPEATVEEDYLLSNTYYGTEARVAASARGMKMSVDAARALLTVDRSYLQAALAEVHGRYTSLDNYRRTQLDLSDADLARLETRMLEP